MLRNAFCVFVTASWVTVLMPFVLVAMLVTWSTDTSRPKSPLTLLFSGGTVNVLLVTSEITKGFTSRLRT